MIFLHYDTFADTNVGPVDNSAADFLSDVLPELGLLAVSVEGTQLAARHLPGTMATSNLIFTSKKRINSNFVFPLAFSLLGTINCVITDYLLCLPRLDLSFHPQTVIAEASSFCSLLPVTEKKTDSARFLLLEGPHLMNAGAITGKGG